MEWLTHSQTGYQQAARYLLGMRLAVILLQLIAIAVAETMVVLAYRAEALIVCIAYVVMSALCWLWFTRQPPRRARTVSLVLLADLLMIGAWLYFTGGYTNPMVSLLLLPIAIAIILVRPGQGIALTVAGVAIYSALVIWHTPITEETQNPNLATLHLAGMWATFAMTAGILLLAVGAMSRRLRHQQSRLAEVRESRLRDEQVIALGLSAASVAHRLGTPLNTVGLLVEEIKSSLPAKDPMAEDLAMIEQQLALCSTHLRQLSTAASEARTAQVETLAASYWLARLKESATLLWPGAALEWQQPFPDSPVALDATLDQAVLNLVANAITASPSWVSVSASVQPDARLELMIEDRGNGLNPGSAGAPGEQIVDSERGLGVGLFLSNATIQRFGGSLKARVTDAGTTMIIDLPIAQAINGRTESAL
jgi:two-component system sensor histidine kinase RegB